MQVLWLYSRRLVNQTLAAQPGALPKCTELHPPEECAEDCSGLGLCVAGACVCPAGFGGPTCGVAQCPGNCSGHGLCLQDHSCLCSRVRPPIRTRRYGDHVPTAAMCGTAWTAAPGTRLVMSISTMGMGTTRPPTCRVHLSPSQAPSGFSSQCAGLCRPRGFEHA
jgi:hypothetical protein